MATPETFKHECMAVSRESGHHVFAINVLMVLLVHYKIVMFMMFLATIHLPNQYLFGVASFSAILMEMVAIIMQFSSIYTEVYGNLSGKFTITTGYLEPVPDADVIGREYYIIPISSHLTAFGNSPRRYRLVNIFQGLIYFWLVFFIPIRDEFSAEREKSIHYRTVAFSISFVLLFCLVLSVVVEDIGYKSATLDYQSAHKPAKDHLQQEIRKKISFKRFFVLWVTAGILTSIPPMIFVSIHAR